MDKFENPSLEYLLLGYLYEEPKHGYDLIKEFKDDQAVQLLWQAKPGKIYFWLKKFEENSLLHSRDVADDTRPTRTVYELTEAGRIEFLAWLQSPVSKPRHMRMALLARLHFALGIDPAIAEKLLDTQMQECRNWLEEINTQAKQNGEAFVQKQIFSYRKKQIECMISWLSECRQELHEIS